MRLNVEGMTCGHCERSVKQAIAALGGLAQVDLTSGTVDVQGVDDVAAVRRAIENEGYTVVEAGAGQPKSGCCSNR